MAIKLRPDLDNKLLIKRISDVGPVPRYVFRDNTAFQERKKCIRIEENGDINEAHVLTALTDGSAISESPLRYEYLFENVNIETTNAEGVKSTNYEQ